MLRFLWFASFVISSCHKNILASTFSIRFALEVHIRIKIADTIGFDESIFSVNP
jgi:hypothetical protein